MRQRSTARPAGVATAVAAAVAGDYQLKFRIRISDGGQIAIGPGKVALLELIGATGSISAAARELGMSYRRAWLLLDEMNGALRRPATETAAGGASGGGTVLTETGRQIVELYRRIEQEAAQHCRDDIGALMALVAA